MNEACVRFVSHIPSQPGSTQGSRRGFLEVIGSVRKVTQDRQDGQWAWLCLGWGLRSRGSWTGRRSTREQIPILGLLVSPGCTKGSPALNPLCGVAGGEGQRPLATMARPVCTKCTRTMARRIRVSWGGQHHCPLPALFSHRTSSHQDKEAVSPFPCPAQVQPRPRPSAAWGDTACTELGTVRASLS